MKKELKVFLGKLVQEMINVKAINDNAQKDSFKKHSSSGVLSAYDWVFHEVVTILKPKNVKENQIIRVNNKGGIIVEDIKKQDNVVKSKKTPTV